MVEKQLTTSFFKQDHSNAAKQRAMRQKKASIANIQQQALAREKSLTSAPPKLVSSTTKNKLSSFAFNPKKTMGKDREDSVAIHDENELAAMIGPKRIGGADHEKENDKEPSKSSQSSLPPATPKNEASKTIPNSTKTPVSRFQLSKFMNMAETPPSMPSSTATEVFSPEDRVEWDTAPRSPFIASQQLPSAKRRNGTKVMDLSTPVPKKKTIDLEMNLKTPTADPAAELWSKYSSAEDLAADLVQPSLAAKKLFGDKQQRLVGGSPSGLRRSYSCGIDWPRPRPKRRKVEGRGSVETGDIGEDIAHPAKSRPSRMSKLVNQMHANIGKMPPPSASAAPPSPILDHGHPSSSAPPAPTSPTSRIRQRSEEAEIGGHPSSPAHLPPSSPTSRIVNNDDRGGGPFKRASSEESDEFGEFDEDMMEVADEMIAQTQAQGIGINLFAINSESPTYVPGSNPFRARTKSPVSKRTASPQAAVLDGESEDEFGDDDFGEFEALVSKYDIKPEEVQPEAVKSEVSAKPIVDDEDDEFAEFDNWDVDDLELLSTTDGKTGDIMRFTVTHVEDKKDIGQKELQVEDKNGKPFKIILCEDWYRSAVNEQDVLNLIGRFVGNTCVVTNAENMVILYPDYLIASTNIADSFVCLRRNVLKERVKTVGDTSLPLLYGNILHELFQHALEHNRFSTAFLQERSEVLLKRRIMDLYTIRHKLQKEGGIEGVRAYIQAKLVKIQEWARKFVSHYPKADAALEDHRSNKKPLAAVNKVLDIEEKGFSPRYGLKGNIDATLQIKLDDSEGCRTLAVPLELKTGRNAAIAMHRAQTMLYTLLLSDRYDIDIQSGLLLYLESGETIRVSAHRDELRHMIMQRNELAGFVKNRDSLPSMLRKQHDCQRCYQKESCFAFHKGVEGGNGDSSGVGATFDELTKCMTGERAQFFKHWESLLTKEEGDIAKILKELWTMDSTERELVGRCFGGLKLVPGSTHVHEEGAKINRFTYTFKKAVQPMHGFSFVESQIGPGEPIVISDEKGHYALANGYVAEVTDHYITVQVDRRLHNSRIRQKEFSVIDNQSFSSIMELPGLGPASSPPKSEEITYRLDKDEFSNNLSIVRNNLVQLFSSEDESKERVRELIVDYATPKFKEQPTQYHLDATQTGLNEDQKAAIFKVMSAQDYALVLGMPGTGKTTTIAHIIRALVLQGKSVLLTSYMHTAVDNILLKIRKDVEQQRIRLLRLGTGSKVHPLVKEFAEMADKAYENFEQIRDAFHSPNVVATTCLTINHILFKERAFDYCIIDEASQITLPVCLGPILKAKTFILVGDHYQLPPLVRDPEARKGGLDNSLFRILCEKHPQAVVNLATQYRMSEDIMSLSNELIYKGQLKCGSAEIAKQVLHVPDLAGLEKMHPKNDGSFGRCKGIKQSCWIREILDESVRAVFANTDALNANEAAKTESTLNPVEITLTLQLVFSFLSCGINASEIGIISPYRSQIKAIANKLASSLPSNIFRQLETHTADKYQGRDKEVIIFGLVRSNDTGNVGELLKDWRRINVAMTRAKKKMIIIGSKSTVRKGDEVLRKLVELMERKKWMLDLPAMAVSGHGDINPFMSITAFPTSTTSALKSTPLTPPRSSPNATNVLRERNDLMNNSPASQKSTDSGKSSKAQRSSSGENSTRFRKPAKVARRGTKGFAKSGVLHNFWSELGGKDRSG